MPGGEEVRFLDFSPFCCGFRGRGAVSYRRATRRLIGVAAAEPWWFGTLGRANLTAGGLRWFSLVFRTRIRLDLDSIVFRRR